MDKCIFVGCDLHDRSLVLRWAVDRGPVEDRGYGNSVADRGRLVAWLTEQSKALGGASVYFAYEASGQGFGLYDELTAAGFTCFVVPPSHLEKSPKAKRRKTDRNDASALLQLVRAHVLAGNAMPQVWVPDLQGRDDREVVRARGDVVKKVGVTKRQIRMLLKRNGLTPPEETGQGWTCAFRGWLDWLCEASNGQPSGVRVGLSTLVRQLAFLEQERTTLDGAVKTLSQQTRHRPVFDALIAPPGVGLVTAMTFVTELGDLSRFANRRQLGAYLGLVPSSDESGETDDRKGRITRQGPSRVRHVLCQAVHAWRRGDRSERKVYERLVSRNPKRKQKAVVACMRRLGVRLWHIGRDAQQKAGVYPRDPAAMA